MGNRPRLIEKQSLKEKITDPLEFSINKSSLNARRLADYTANFSILIWADKHYFVRQQFGGDDGTLREGIELENINSLVKLSVNHLFYYSSIVPGFNFVNYDKFSSTSKRVVIRIKQDSTYLNIVTATSLTDSNEYEITIFTAMMTDEFRLSEGQYLIEVIDKENSILYRYLRKKLEETCFL